MPPKDKKTIEPINASFDDVAESLAKNIKGRKVTGKKVLTKEGGILEVQGIEIHLVEREKQDYISLTDMTKAFPDGETLIKGTIYKFTLENFYLR